jgi:hypothetical protein
MYVILRKREWVCERGRVGGIRPVALSFHTLNPHIPLPSPGKGRRFSGFAASLHSLLPLSQFQYPSPLPSLPCSLIQAKDDDSVVDLIQFASLDNPTKQPALSEKASGNWRLVWSQQAANASALQKFGSQQVGGRGAAVGGKGQRGGRQRRWVNAGGKGVGPGSLSLGALIFSLPSSLFSSLSHSPLSPPFPRCAQADSFQIVDGKAGTVKNLVLLAGGAIQLSADAEGEPAGDARTTVLISQAELKLGPLRFPFTIKRSENNPGYIDW